MASLALPEGKAVAQPSRLRYKALRVSSRTSLSFSLFPFFHENVVSDGVPGVVDADEEQEQRGSADEEQGWPRMGAGRAG